MTKQTQLNGQTISRGILTSLKDGEVNSSPISQTIEQITKQIIEQCAMLRAKLFIKIILLNSGKSSSKEIKVQSKETMAICPPPVRY